MGWFGQSEIILHTDNNFYTSHNFQINIQKITQIRKSWAPLFSNQKKNFGFSQLLKSLMDLNHKTFFLINKNTFLNMLDTFHVKSWKLNWMYVRKKNFNVSCTWYQSLLQSNFEVPGPLRSLEVPWGHLVWGWFPLC